MLGPIWEDRRKHTKKKIETKIEHEKIKRKKIFFYQYISLRIWQS